MAQAARLNLRMQKELTLLVTDQPSGFSLCNDLSSSSSSSLSSIDAVIEGPEGTVYANGLFKINIQIPDRYPFQPPNVTFATPIYHPNIDNGGRICLDILNLPPKGAWQPSLNISTILMSIRLLLSEPNPDDGLMCEASREYKYNRQAFDRKARSMTEKYATSCISVSSTSSGGTPANRNLVVEAENHSLEFRNIDNQINGEQEKHSMSNKKLSLEFCGTSEKRNYDDKDSTKHTDKSSFLNSQGLAMNPSTFLPTPKVGVNHAQPLCQDNTCEVENNIINMSSKKLFGNAQKLSLKSAGPFPKAVSNNKENVVQTLCSDRDTEIVSMNSSDSPGIDQNSIEDQGDAGSNSTSQGKKKVYGIGRKLSLHSSCSPPKGKSHKHSHSNEPFTASLRSCLMPLNDNCNGKQLDEVHNEKANEHTTKMRNKKSEISNQSMKVPTSKNENDDDKENIPPNYQLALTTSSTIIMPQSGIRDGLLQHEKHNQAGNSQKGSSGIGKNLFMHSLVPTRRNNIDLKSNASPVEKLSFSEYGRIDEASSKIVQLPHAEELHQYSGEAAENRNMKQNEEEEALITDAVIVLDSEDSDEEVKGPMRSRLCLTRKPLAGKRKLKA